MPRYKFAWTNLPQPLLKALARDLNLGNGEPADLLSFDGDDPRFAGCSRDGWLDRWLFAGGAIDCVWRAGVKQVSGGRHRMRDAIVQRFAATIAMLLA